MKPFVLHCFSHFSKFAWHSWCITCAFKIWVCLLFRSIHKCLFKFDRNLRFRQGCGVPHNDKTVFANEMFVQFSKQVAYLCVLYWCNRSDAKNSKKSHQSGNFRTQWTISKTWHVDVTCPCFWLHQVCIFLTASLKIAHKTTKILQRWEH